MSEWFAAWTSVFWYYLWANQNVGIWGQTVQRRIKKEAPRVIIMYYLNPCMASLDGCSLLSPLPLCYTVPVDKRGKSFTLSAFFLKHPKICVHASSINWILFDKYFIYNWQEIKAFPMRCAIKDHAHIKLKLKEHHSSCAYSITSALIEKDIPTKEVDDINGRTYTLPADWLNATGLYTLFPRIDRMEFKAGRPHPGK